MTDNFFNDGSNREIIELIKVNMLEEKKRNDEYCQLQSDYISFLKNETWKLNKIARNQDGKNFGNTELTTW